VTVWGDRGAGRRSTFGPSPLPRRDAGRAGGYWWYLVIVIIGCSSPLCVA
jgi:hypothetical protein